VQSTGTVTPARNPHFDDETVSRCIAGDGRAWRELIEHFRRLVYSVPRRAGLPADACDDVFQEVFTILHAKIASLERRTALPQWLATTARRVTLRWLDRHRREQRPPVPEAAECADPESVDDVVRRWERIGSVRAALERLGPPCQGLLEAIARAGDRPDYRVLAESLGMPVGSIGPSRARCLSKLLAILRIVDVDASGEFSDRPADPDGRPSQRREAR
jgi:RNA polymerase sigma factor (sigma-70 family)